MKKFVIVTDSCANLTDEIINKYDLPILSLSVVADDVNELSYVKGEPNKLKTYYTLLRNKKRITTSCINGTAVYEMFSEFLKNGFDILYIAFSSGLSNTYAVAMAEIEHLRKKFTERKILVSDSLSASLGEGLLVYKALEMKEHNHSIDEIYQWCENNKLKCCHFFTVDNLYYLYMGGRVKKTSYLIANAIRIKPIMHVNNSGKLVAIGKALGRKHSIIALANHLKAHITDSVNQTIFISHGDCIEDANLLAEKIKEKVQVKEIIINYVDIVVGAHSGPGTLAVFFLGEKR